MQSQNFYHHESVANRVRAGFTPALPAPPGVRAEGAPMVYPHRAVSVRQLAAWPLPFANCFPIIN